MGKHRAVAHALAQLNCVGEAEDNGDLGTDAPADSVGLDLGELTFEFTGKTAVKMLAHHGSQDRVAEELQSLVACHPVGGNRRVHQSLREQGLVGELITNALLDNFERDRFTHSNTCLWASLGLIEASSPGAANAAEAGGLSSMSEI